MSDQALASALEHYRAGLEAEIALLHQLEAVATRQRDVTETRELERFAAESDARDHLMASLVKIEEGQKSVRALLITHKEEASKMPRYHEVLALRKTATDLVQRILASDEASMRALADAELARRAAVASLERGETTLAAYRKVLAPHMGHASLLDIRG